VDGQLIYPKHLMNLSGRLCGQHCVASVFQIIWFAKFSYYKTFTVAKPFGQNQH